MNSKQIESFLCVADCLNISVSAQKLYQSQSTISRQISLLEEELGFELFHRGNNYLRLTPAGAVMCRKFKEICQLFESGMQEAKITNEGYDGALRVGFYSSIQIKPFNQILQEFCHRYPQVKLSYGCASEGTLEDCIKENGFDIMLCHDFDEVSSSDFFREYICNTSQFLLFGAMHPLAEKENISFRDFKNEVFWNVRHRNGKKLAENREKIFHYYGIKKWKEKTAKNLDEVLMNVQVGNGCLFLDPYTGMLNNKLYRKLELAADVSNMGIHVVWNKDNLNPAIPLFLNICIQKTV